MASSDTLGYPIKKHFYRLHLESAWQAAFGALDMGDFETFLKESADRTYPDALAQIRKMGAGRSETSRIKEAQEYEVQGGIEQYRMVADGLRQEGKEYEASAIEALIADLVAAQSKAKAQRKPAEKREPKQKPLVALAPAQPELSLLIPTIHGKDFDWLHNIIIADGLSDLELAAEEIKRPHTDLTEQDRKYLLELIEPRKAAYVQKYEKGKGKEIITKLPTSAPPQKKITTSREITRKREEGIKESKEEEQVPPFTAVEYEIRTINLQNAKIFLRDYQQHIPAMLQAGLQKWLETHRSAFKFPLTTHNIDSLSDALQYSIVQPSAKNIRGMVAVQFLSKHSPDILVRGLEKASGSFAWGQVYSYYKDTLKTDLPPIDKFKQDVLGAAKAIKFEFG